MIDNNIEDEANEQEIRRIRRRELSERLPFHCGQLMRYDEIENGDVLDRRRLTGTYYCERCCTMQPTYEGVTEHDDDAPAAPERGDRERWTHIVDEHGNHDVYGYGVRRICRATSMELAEQIAIEHNQHSTLIAQRGAVAGVRQGIG